MFGHSVADTSILLAVTAISVPSFDKLPSVIDMLITAIRAGELDQQLAQTGKQATPKSKAA